jgi:putative two-component system response regulator
MIRTALERWLASDGHAVSVASDGREALELIGRLVPDLILTDLDMPRLNGFDLCRTIKEAPATRLIPIVVISGSEVADAKLRVWELGADDFLTKPFEKVEVLARCRSLLRVKRLIDDLESAESVVYAFARTVEAKCRYTWGHSERVARYALALAREIGLGESDLAVLRKGALLHDIGKISIPDAILNKPGALTAEEYDVIKQHPAQGTRIVEPLKSLRDAIPIIRWHHERRDGSGYPDRLLGDAIPLLTRILSVADVYDALSSERPYRPALPPETCKKILLKDAAEGGLDPGLVDVFCRIIQVATTATVPHVEQEARRLVGSAVDGRGIAAF